MVYADKKTERHIMKSFDCLRCKNLVDWDCDIEDNCWFQCKFEPEVEVKEDNNPCPLHEENDEEEMYGDWMIPP